MFRFCKRDKPTTKIRITLIDIIILINKELSTFTLTVTKCIGHAVSRRLSLCFAGTMPRLRMARVGSHMTVHLLSVSTVVNDNKHQVYMSTKCLSLLPDYALPYCGEAASLSTAVLGAYPPMKILIFILVFTMYSLFWFYYLGYF
jgi:hypothetical protein